MSLSTTGKIGKAIVAKAGPGLAEACKALAPIDVGEVKETDGFALPNAKVLHCRCPPYKGYQTIQVRSLTQTVCLIR